jgi:hypothetical protein
MLKSTLTAAALVLLLAGPAIADHDDDRRWGDDRDRYDHRDDDREHDRDRNRGNGRGNGNGNGHAYGHDRDRDHDRGRDDNDWNRGRDDNDWNRRRHDNDWNRYDRWRHDGWRYEHGNDDYFWRRGNDWRFVPPARYRSDHGYRSGYEMAWRDFDRYGRNDRSWRRRAHQSRLSLGYLKGYDAGWRDAQRYYRVGYRPRYWLQDPFGSWFFGFRNG